MDKQFIQKSGPLSKLKLANSTAIYKGITLVKTTQSKQQENTVRGNTKTTREDWLAEAQRVLIEEGIERVKVDRLAKKLNVTRGGFYWFFENRQDILNMLLNAWSDRNNDPIIGAVEEKADNTLQPFIRFFSVIIGRGYSPALDSAMRDWARTSTQTRQAVETVDNRRIKVLTQAFINLHYPETEAFIRARVLYFHQVGYYAMNVHETRKKRLEYLPVYFKQLIGFDLPIDEI